MSIKITGLDKLERELKELADASKALDGTIAKLEIDPKDPQSVRDAIRKMEAAVDIKTSRYSSNPHVKELAKKMKETYRQAILKKEDR